jgi:hypothetical protein
MNTIHWNILDQKRKDILPLLKSISFDDGFYLAGGTGLALQMGHRDSIDFDFFKQGDFDTDVFLSKLENIFTGHLLMVTQNEKNTISCIIDDTIKFSFFGFKYKVLRPFIETEYFNLASIEDIACMKFSATLSRSLEKDYVDLYFILQSFDLKTLIDISLEKFENIDSALILKSLIYFDDIVNEPIIFKENHEVSFEVVKDFLKKTVKGYYVA